MFESFRVFRESELGVYKIGAGGGAICLDYDSVAVPCRRPRLK